MNGRYLLTLLVVAAASALEASAQAAVAAADTTATTDSVFLRIQRLAANGQGDAARALVQQEFDAAPTGSSRYVQALYWRAVVAATAADAERDLRTLVVDYPLSPWSVEALMRLAQLEMTRGDMDKALAHLDRVLAEHPTDPARPRASFWEARVMFEQGRVPDACRRLAVASSDASPTDVELRDQIEFWMTRCTGVDTTLASIPAGHGDSTRPARAPAAAPATAAPAKREFCVQVGAYDSRPAAEKFALTLRDRGYDSRVHGNIPPYRVRIGRYATRAQADSAAQKLNAKKIAGFVTEAEPR